VAYPNPSSNLSQSSVSTDVTDDFKADSDVSVKGKGASANDTSDDASKSSKKSSKAGKSKSSKSKKEAKKDKKNSKKSQKMAPEDSDDAQAEADQTYNLGLESYRNGNYADAEKFWQQTLEIDPNHVQAKKNLIRLKAEHPDLP
jgi:tetratricopeptide (TPR) repeat protein